MHALVIGATGYIGSAVARAFRARGWHTSGLSRSTANGVALAAAGIDPVDGNLQDLPPLQRLAAPFDIVAFCAMVPLEVELAIVSALIESGGGRRRHLLFTSGTGVLAITSRDGRWNDYAAAEDDPFPFPERPV